MNAEAERNPQNKFQSVSESTKEEKQISIQNLSEYESPEAIGKPKIISTGKNTLGIQESCSLNPEMEGKREIEQTFPFDEQLNLNFTKKDFVKNIVDYDAKNNLGAYSKDEKFKDQSKIFQKPKLELSKESPENAGNSLMDVNQDDEFATENPEINFRQISSKNLNLELREGTKESQKNNLKTTPKNIKNSAQSPGFPSNCSNKVFIGLSKLSSFQSSSLQNNYGSDKIENLLNNPLPTKSENNQINPSLFEAIAKLNPNPIEVKTFNQNQERYSPELLKQKNQLLLGSGPSQNTNLTLQNTLNPNINLVKANNMNQFQSYQNQTQNESLHEYQKAPVYEASLTPPRKNPYNLMPNQKMHPAENCSEIISNDFIRKPLPINRLGNVPCGPQPQIKAFPGADLFYKYTSNMPLEVLLMREKEEEKKKTHKCNCKKSRCLKLYCECFANGEYCIGCSCQDCANILENEKEKLEAFNYVKDKNPVAMKLINKVNKELKLINNAPNNFKNFNLSQNNNINNNATYSFYKGDNPKTNTNNFDYLLTDKRNSFENEEVATAADFNNSSGNYNNNSNQLNVSDRNFNSMNNLNNLNYLNNNCTNNDNNQAFNNALNITNSNANMNCDSRKSPIIKNFFDENNSNNMQNQSLNPSLASNLKQSASNNRNINISNYNPNVNLTNNLTPQENIYVNYNTFNNNNSNNNLNLNNNNLTNNLVKEQIIGCNCTKSNCTKKYCECFKAGKTCIEACRCRDCDNIDCLRREQKNKRKYKHGNALPGSVYEEFVIEKISIHIEKSNIFIKESVIWDLRDINKKETSSVSNVNNSTNNNAIKQEYSDFANKINREKSDMISLNNKNNDSKSLLINEKSANLSPKFDESLLKNKESESRKANYFNSAHGENNAKKVNFIPNDDLNLFPILNKNSFISEGNKDYSRCAKSSENNVAQKKSLLKNKINLQEQHQEKTLGIEKEDHIKYFDNNSKNKTTNKIEDQNINDDFSIKEINEPELLKKNLTANNSDEINSPFNNKICTEVNLKNKLKEINLMDISFENKTPSGNENNSKDEYLFEEASYLSELNNSLAENLHGTRKKKEPINSATRVKKIKFILEDEDKIKTPKSSPEINHRENNNEVEKIILSHNYKNFVTKNTFDTVSSFHNSVKNGITKDDLCVGLLSNNARSINDNLHLGLLNNANTEEVKFENPHTEIINKNTNYSVLLDKALIQKDEGLLNKKKARDHSN